MISFLKKQVIRPGFSAVDSLAVWKKHTVAGGRTAFFVILSAIVATVFMPFEVHAGDNNESKLKVKTILRSRIDILNNRDLDSGKDDSLSILDPELRMEILYEATDYFEIFTEIEATRRFVLTHGDDISSPSYKEELNLRQVYFGLKDRPVDGLGIRFGRQEFEDEREWLYDQELDGLRLFYKRGSWSAELSATRLSTFRKNLLSDDDDEHLNYYMVYGSYQPGTQCEFNAYAILIDDRSRVATEQALLGLRSRGTLLDTLGYWAELATVRGRDEGVELRGYGFDLGATYRFSTMFSPSLSVAYAFGSGDGDTEDSVDSNFRQTGIHDNTGSFNGVEDFQFYGETLDPELSNIHIITAGLGIRPTKKSSLDLIYHHYRQDTIREGRLRNAWIREKTLGESGDLGQELDLVIAYHEIKNLQLYVRYGLFFPGEAFPDSADTASSLKVGFKYTF